MPEPSREFLLQLLSDARIKGPLLDVRVNQALDADYWRGLVPDLHVGAASPLLECAPADPAEVGAAVHGESQDGYFHLPGVIAPEGVRRLNGAIDAVTGAGWPPSFVFVYDEAWLCARSPRLTPLLESVLGPGYSQICHVWAHVVKPIVGATGWGPHTDGRVSSNARARMSVWIGLTDATLDNGCMHVIPRRTSASPPDLMARFASREGQFVRGEVSSLLHASHALVTSPGDALGWAFDIIHWGGMVRRVGPERRAISFEFLAADEAPEGTDGPTTSMDGLPPFATRLNAIATGVIAYRRFEPIVDRFTDVAKEIKNRLA